MRVVEAQIEAATGRRDEASESFTAVVRDAARYGFQITLLEARLLRAEVEVTSGKANTGRSELAAVRLSATGKGFGLIAQKATAFLTNK